MNERIQELAEQADAYADAMDIGGKNYIGLRDEYFAELIIRECANELLKWKSEPFPLDAECAARIIKEHFGVK